MTFSRWIAAPYGLCQDGSLKRNVLLEIKEDGTLVSVDFGIADFDSISAVEYYNGILIPSVTNAHCHIELSDMRGQIPEGIGLTAFFDYLSSHNLKYDAKAFSVQDKLMWKEGVSAVGDVSNTCSTLHMKTCSSIWYNTFVEYYGHGCKRSVESYIEYKIGSILKECVSLGLDAIPSPHSTYLVSPEAFAYASKVGVLYTHFMESLSEKGFFAGNGKMYDYLKIAKPYPYNSAVDMLKRLLPSNTKLVLVHCTTMEPNDIEELESFFSDVTYVLCPRSNYYIERTMPPAELLYRYGCKVAIGTDSIASNHSLSMAKEIALLSRDNPSIPLESLLSWATIGGANALGYQEKMGYFRKGIRSGAVLVTGVDLNTKKIGPNFKLERIV